MKEHGILNPVIARKSGRGYEMLSGHNRQNAVKLAGFAEIPSIVKDGIAVEQMIASMVVKKPAGKKLKV